MGYLTRALRETGTAAGQVGSTAAADPDVHPGQVNHSFCIRPSYVTIIGDDELVPTFTRGARRDPVGSARTR